MPTRTVQLDVGVSGLNGIAALTEGASVSFTLSDRLKVGTTLVVPESVVATAGSSVALEVTPAGWAYKVEIWTRKERHRPLWVIVPDGASTHLVDLPVVDPKTLEIDPDPASAWALALAEVQAAASTATTKAGEAAGSASAAAADRALAETARTGAETARGGSETAQTAAEAARDLAIAQSLAGVSLSTQDLNTLTTSGIYRQETASNATTARNYPRNADRGILEVYRLSGTAECIQRYTVVTWEASAGAFGHFERRRYASGTWSTWRLVGPRRVVQPSGQPGVELTAWDDINGVDRTLVVQNVSLGTFDLNAVINPGIYNQTNGGNATLAANYPKAGVAGVLTVKLWNGGAPVQVYEPYPTVSGGPNRHVGHWERSYRGTTWSPWAFLAAQRIDKTAGLAIYTADEQGDREQLIYGDTGRRGITSMVTLPTGITISASAGAAEAFYVRRVGSRVTLTCIEWLDVAAAVVATTFVTLPVGFRGYSNQGDKAPILRRDGLAVIGAVQALDTGGIRIGTTGAATGSTGFSISYDTADPWPTSLPGTAVGTIPNT